VASEVRFGEVRALLERHGWTLRRVSASHHIFKKKGDRLFSVPVHRGKVNRGMSAKSKTMSVKGKAIDRLFAADVWRRAMDIARRYQVVMWLEDGEYYGRVLVLPGVMGDGKTPDACMEQTREALTVAVATLLEDGEAPPRPSLTRGGPPRRQKARSGRAGART